MTIKKPSSKRPPKGASAAKSARGRRPPAARWRLLGPIRPDWLLLALVALALALRLWGIHHRLPDSTLGIDVLNDTAIEETDRTTMGRAWSMWGGGAKPLDLNPHTGGWPALSFYLTLGVQHGYKAYYSMTHDGAAPRDFANYAARNTGSLFLLGRIVGALIGVLTVYLIYRIAARFFGRPVGLLAGLLLATNALHILISQHVSDPNLLALLFVLLATAPMLRIAQGGSMRDSIRAGAMLGLAGACKYVPLVLALPLTLAHRAAGDDKRPPLWRNRALLYSLLAIGIALFIATPYLLIDWKRTLIDIAGQRKALFSDWVGQTQFPISLPTYLASSIPHAIGWPAYLLGLAGMALLWRSGRVGRMLVWIPALTVVANGMLKSPQERYILVAVPFLHLGAALALIRGAGWLRTRAPSAAAAYAAPALAAALAIAWPLPELIATRHSMSLPDSRHLARKWIGANVDPNRPIAVELYGPVFADNERAMVIWPFFATQVQLARPAFHVEFLDGLDYYVASGEISRRFEADSVNYPVENAYYRWLRDNAPLVWHTSSGETSGPLIEVRRLPANISSRAERDSLFAAAMPTPTRVNRIGLLCLDLSKMFARVRDWDRAEEWARRGLYVGVDAMRPNLYLALAVPLFRKGHPDSAEHYAALSVKEAPKSAPPHLYHAAVLTSLRRHEEALGEFQQAYALSGGDPGILNDIAQALSQLGRYEEAVQTLNRVPPTHPQRAMARRNAAVLMLTRLNRPEEALEALRESIQLDPNQEGADRVRAQIAILEAARKR